MINAWTNLSSVVTPNGQAAFLLAFVLASLLRLSYGTIVSMTLPYSIVLMLVGLLCRIFKLNTNAQFND